LMFFSVKSSLLATAVPRYTAILKPLRHLLLKVGIDPAPIYLKDPLTPCVGENLRAQVDLMERPACMTRKPLMSTAGRFWKVW
jgi:hypothetical protein